MTDRDEQPTADGTKTADDLQEAVADLGETREDQLETVAERNDSLEERLPGQHAEPQHGSPDQG
ncbi:hypothetical protein IT072_08950 [Leifsonia sp. ZF2019]|uniref:hypothetical protein n=1 Tax=Leifsonia sp. ZF2019 TaxID=2781978 RepID=UPI001CBEEAF5|nr:hypothetical protein [Leifsonia sp. ZF2019]UAJ81090.1 hypothetical protein IT072_08950 [Leifsonia sp. ZF2019]